jgi:tripartite-type tricarboxylate transporter receptor subunit TctC
VKALARAAGRALAALLAGALALAVVVPAAAAAYPDKPVRILNGGAAGSVTDIVARQLAEKLAPLLGQAVIVESRPSGGGIVALDALKNSPADGHTLGLVHFVQMSVAPSMFDHLPYDTVNDFAHLGILFRGPQVLVANPAVHATNLAELIELAKAHPGQLRYASPGNGTPSHVFMEQFKQVAAIDIQHIPYRGPAANTAVLGGEVQLLIEGPAAMLPHIRAGKLRALAVGGTRRLAVLPDVPTFEELGIPGITTVWVGMVAPRGTPREIIARLHHELAKVLESPDIRALFEQAGRSIELGTPEEMEATIRSEIPRWRDLVLRAHIKPD